MIIHKITPIVYYIWWLKRKHTQLNEPTNQNSIKVPKVFKPSNKKRLNKTFWTSVINSPLSPPSLDYQGWYLWYKNWPCLEYVLLVASQRCSGIGQWTINWYIFPMMINKISTRKVWLLPVWNMYSKSIKSI